jgi:AcrR family transcriptional regulator
MNDTAVARKPASRKPRKVTTAPENAEKPYHHGDLPQALLKAAETVLRRDGIGGLTLRAIAREAGVSHTAPQHHFGDTAGVLSELAADGFFRLAAATTGSSEGIRGSQAQRKAIARGYISFAKKNPDLMRLMARSEMLDSTRPSLIAGHRAAALALSGTLPDAPAAAPATPRKNSYDRVDATRAVAMIAGWAYVHGLAVLLIDGRLSALAASTDGIRDADELVEAAIEHVQLVAGKVG